MNTDQKIVKILEDLKDGQNKLEAGQKALQSDVQKQGKDIAAFKNGQEQQGKQIETLVDVQEQQWKQYAQKGNILAGLGATAGTILEEQQAQRIDIRSLHTEVHSSKEELKAEILSSRAEAKMENVDLKATVVRQLKDHEKRIDELEDATGIPHPDKN